MKILIITQGVSRIVQPLVQTHNIVGMIEASPKKTSSFLRVVFEILRFIYSKVNKNFSLKDVCIRLNIPYLQMNNFSNGELVNWIKALDPDLIVVFSMSQLLKENVFTIPKYGTINLHPSYLPKYRGPFPDFWMYHDMDLEPGVTVHYIDKGEDTGDIIYQEKFQMELGTKSPEMLERAIDQIGIQLLLRAIEAIEQGNAPRIKQPINSPTVRARKVRKEEHKDFIKWDEWPVERVWHFLRGTETWLNALDQPKLIGFRWEVMHFDKMDTKGFQLGEIYKDKESSYYFVACSDGKVYIRKKFSIKNILRKLVRKQYG